MNVKQRRRFDMFARVDRFGIAHGDAFPRNSAGRQLFNMLRDILARLSEHSVVQASGHRQEQIGTAAKTSARESLYAAMCAISRTARALAINRPGFRGKFRLPSRESDQALIASARVFAGNARRLSSGFVAYGLRSGFVGDLSGAIARFEHAIAHRDANRRAHATARTGIDAALVKASSIVRQLDAVVFNVMGEDAVALENWRRARRLARLRTPNDRRPRRARARLTVIQPQHEKVVQTPL